MTNLIMTTVARRKCRLTNDVVAVVSVMDFFTFLSQTDYTIIVSFSVSDAYGGLRQRYLFSVLFRITISSIPV
ncbi:hypothetical protein IQ276_037940 [Desmonostoc muscorum LEGE 12446]|uniref:hypothetical protein n=1 Tax=Desmonostoc muscorum TaxID=1179 RepID=UPI001F451C23|nr:hypothetical protein [Desmonostoc muscorum]MCF2152083.1 hypothetical protein [Desmonostoc muscorum LEGE 12446]